MSRFFLSCENKQELVDLIEIAQALHDNYGYDVLYFDIAPLLSGGQSDSVEIGLFERQWRAKCIKGRLFKEMSVGLKLLTSFVNAFRLALLYYSNRAHFVLVGTPLLTYRLARILTFGNLRLVSYIRGVIAYSDENTSISSRIFLRFGKLKKFQFLSGLLSDYYASLVICIGNVTARFIASRGVPKRNIKVVGSVYCDKLLGGEGIKGEKTVVFVSSAFAFHGYEDAQQAQTALIRLIKNYISEQHPRLRFVVRPHPREANIYGPDLAKCLDLERGDPLIRYPSNALFISPVSTLIMELACAGRQSFIVADEFLHRRFGDWYEAVGVTPIRDWTRLIENYVGENIEEKQDFQGSISTKFQGSVVAQIAYEINGMART